MAKCNFNYKKRLAEDVFHQALVVPKENELLGLIDGTLTEFKMPKNVTEIAPYRFHSFTNLASIDLTGVTKIGGYAFTNCTGLTSIEIPSTVTVIESNAFSGCTGLTSVKCDFAKKPSGWANDWIPDTITVEWTEASE